MLFFKINLHFVTLNLISTDRKLNFPLINSSFLVFLRIQIETDEKRTETDKSILLLLSLKRID